MIKLLIVDDHLVVRRGLELLLKPNHGVTIISEASNGLEAIEKTNQHKPDVILMDLKMPKMDGIEATREIIKLHPNARILALTSFTEPDQVNAVIQAGALGYILKDSSAEELINAIHQVADGNLFVPKELANSFRHFQKNVSVDKNNYDLTEREKDVLNLLVSGLTNKEIAEKLFLSDVTARFHVSNIIHKLGVKNRGQVIKKALEEKLI
ncbi:MAG: DNA-binding response regulator [Anaerolineaceae bacterium]|nr:DNA-binding response regulator [Anaerolineaceae bacterium]